MTKRDVAEVFALVALGAIVLLAVIGSCVNRPRKNDPGPAKDYVQEIPFGGEK